MKILFVLTLVICSLNVFSQSNKRIQTIDFKKGGDVNKLLTSEDREVFKNAGKIEVLALDEHVGEIVDVRTEEGQKLNQKGVFHGYKIKKTVAVAGAADRQSITRNLFSAIGNGDVARCFIPRHDIRAAYRGKTVELLICFQCQQLYAFDGNGYKYESISKKMQAALDRLLGKSSKKS